MIHKTMTITLMFMLFLNFIIAEQLSGSVKYDGKAMPKIPKTQVKMDADPVCGSSHKEPVYRQGLIVNENKTLKNVLVYLKDVKYDGKIPETQSVLDQKGCMYEPHVQGMMAGQEILIKNSDATLHNIHALPTINPEFNFAMPHVVKEKAIKIAKPEHAMYIKCDVHPWMKSYISIFNHPYFSVTNDTGHYQIDNIPSGTYKVIAWQEKFKDKETKEWKTLNASVTISDGDTAQDFTFVKKAKKK